MFEETGPAIATKTTAQMTAEVTRVTVWRAGCGVVRGRKINKTGNARLDGWQFWQVIFENNRPTFSGAVPKVCVQAAREVWANA